MPELGPDEEGSRRRRHPVPLARPDRSGRIAAETLECFVVHPGLHTAAELLLDPVFRTRPMADEGEKTIRMRLLRLARQGLLSREREGREYQYEITKSGEKRLIFLWDRLGLTDPSRAESAEAREEMKRRLKTIDSILEERESEALALLGRPVSE